MACPNFRTWAFDNLFITRKKSHRKRDLSTRGNKFLFRENFINENGKYLTPLKSLFFSKKLRINQSVLK